ncbi:ANKL1 protein, partial [Fregetta grallaria]|nr:ANKL1 protein [Fregetta grallaria]
PAPGGARRSLSFLTEDGTEGSGLPEAGPLSSTRRSLLEEPELGGGCGSGEPPPWPGCPPEPPSLAIPSLTPWPHADPGGPALPPQPLASSTLLSAGDELGEGPRSQTVGGRTGAPSPQREFGPGGSLSSPPPRCCSRDPGGHRASPRAPLLRGGLSSCSVACQSPRDGDILSAVAQHRPGVPRGPAVAWAGLGIAAPAAPDLGTTVLEARASGWDRSSLGDSSRHSPELAAALQSGCVPDCTQDELALVRQFDRPDRSRRWREGLVKSSFNYLLLDPRTTQNLPLRSHHLSPAECFRTFVKAIFYVGKGTRARPYCHLAEALSQHRARTQRGCPKVRRILEIWASGQGVISVHCFQSTVPAEAYTREGCLVEALGLQTITNQRKGNCYGVAASWPAARRRRLGVHMLHRAMRIFLAEGERQLRPTDIQGGR